jgi:cytochrome c oxidase assembly protein subunit 11
MSVTVQAPDQDLRARNKKLLVRCLIVVLCMFAFPYASVPLYNAFCSWTGLNGKYDTAAAALSALQEAGRVRYEPGAVARVVTVEFTADASPDLPWTLKPEVSQMKVAIGETSRINFFAENQSSRNIIARAVPSFSPGEGAPYFQKIQCFCFDNIRLEAGQKMEMPVVFYLKDGFPKDVSTITLAYKVFDISDKVKVISPSADQPT